ncbi:YggS family pyridoxal phosphate-dependent enzyme [Georgenia alba]|uniref:Pyridoxal phosphate homeostasis protein n=1 Tax=Georgenia alba TaxID=2233858 RepID=A0ABW2QCW5_9MICO
MDVERLAQRYAAARERVAAAAREAGREPADVRLLLAVKTQPPEVVRAVLEAGADLLGHNRAQELAVTGPRLAEPGVPAHEMHFIGHLQSNKVNQVLRWATCVQTVDSVRLAERLDAAVARRADDGGPASLDVMMQVNTSGEHTKSGVGPSDAVELAGAVGALPRLRLRGLMTIGANSTDPSVVRASYDALADLRDRVVGSGAPGTADARELSMGMSADLEIAVAAGATMVRLGTAVFGPRPAP